MKLLARAMIALLLAMAGIALPSGSARAQGAPKFVPGRILVQFQPYATQRQVRSLLAAANANDTGEIPDTGVHVLQLPPQADEAALANALAHRPEVVSAELDRIVPPAQTTSTPNDTYYSLEWHLPKINAPAAWTTTTGSSSITIAILGTGCDPAHPDLAPKYVPGWNFYNNNSNTADVNGHGTAVAGTAAACSNNGIGVASVAWNCMIMPIRIADANGNCTLSAAASGLTWAANNGARVAHLQHHIAYRRRHRQFAYGYCSRLG